MIDDDYQGIANLLGVTPPRKKPKVLTPEPPKKDPLMDFANTMIRMEPLKLPKNVLNKDEYGYTPAQNKQINDYLTRPATRSSKVPFEPLVKPNVREENALERIDRINYEFGQTKVRPTHLDNKNIVSFEDKQRGSPKVVRKNESKLNQPKRRQ